MEEEVAELIEKEDTGAIEEMALALGWAPMKSTKSTKSQWLDQADRSGGVTK